MNMETYPSSTYYAEPVKTFVSASLKLKIQSRLTAGALCKECTGAPLRQEEAVHKNVRIKMEKKENKREREVGSEKGRGRERERKGKKGKGGIM